MILLKSFTYKKINKIYLIISSILLISIIVLSFFINYYANIVNEIFQRNSYIVVATKNDYYNMLVKNKNITHVTKCLLFKPDYSYNILGREGYEIRNQYGILIDSREPEKVRRLNWEEFLVGGSKLLNESILIFPSSENNLSLENNQIALGVTQFMYKGNLDDLIGESIGFYSNKDKIEFVIDSSYKTDSQEMTIPNDAFQTLSKASESYVYKLIVNGYRKANSTQEKLRSLEKGNKDFTISLNRNSTEEDSKTEQTYRGIIDILTFVSYILIFILIVIVVKIIRKSR